MPVLTLGVGAGGARAHTRPDAEVQAQAEHFAALDQLRGWFDEWAEVVRGAAKSRLAERRTPANSEVSERAGRTRWMQENATPPRPHAATPRRHRQRAIERGTMTVFAT